MRILEALSAYEQFLNAKGLSASGIKRYRYQIRQFAAYANNPEIAAITSEMIEDYREEKSLSCKSGTIGNALSSIRSFCRWSIKKHYCSNDPTLPIEWPRITKPAPTPLSRADVRKLCQSLDNPPPDLTPHKLWIWQRNRRAIYLMLYAGLRISEASALCWRDVDIEAGILTVRCGKGGKDRSLPLHRRLEEEMLQVPLRPSEQAVAGGNNGQPLLPKSMAHIFERWLPRHVGLRFHAHQLRHTFATEMLRRGANVRIIQDTMGHERLETTQRYLLVDVEQLRSAVDLLPDTW